MNNSQYTFWKNKNYPSNLHILEITLKYALLAVEQEQEITEELVRVINHRKIILASFLENSVYSQNKAQQMPGHSEQIRLIDVASASLQRRTTEHANKFCKVIKESTPQISVLLQLLANISELRSSVSSRFVQQLESAFSGNKCELSIPHRFSHISDYFEYVLYPADDSQSSSCIKEVLVSVCRDHREQKQLNYSFSRFLRLEKTSEGKSSLLALLRCKYNVVEEANLSCCQNGRKSSKTFIASFPEILGIRIEGNESEKSAMNNFVEVPERLDLTEFGYKQICGQQEIEYALVAYAYKSGHNFYASAMKLNEKVYLCSNGEAQVRNDFDPEELGIEFCIYRME